MIDNQVPEFCIFQNSRTQQSAIWTKEKGEWQNCVREEYPAILVLASLLRESPDPTATMQQVAKIMRDGSGAAPD